MSDSVSLAKHVVSLWRSVEDAGLEDVASVSAFTSAMWAELVSRGMAASDVLVQQMSTAAAELEGLLSSAASDITTETGTVSGMENPAAVSEV